MHKNHFSEYSEAIRLVDLSKLKNSQSIPKSIEMDRDGDLSIYYIPFDYVNPKAKIALVGITPGFTQFYNAVAEAQSQLLSGKDSEQALIAAKQTGAFSGQMRRNLVKMLDHVKVNQWLGIETCNSLFASDSHLVQTTSVLRYPVFFHGENYNGTPNMSQHPLLQRYLKTYFTNEIKSMQDAIIIPLGPKVNQALNYLVQHGEIDGKMVLDGLPHPSGANNERIKYFVGETPRNKLSDKTNPDILDEAKRVFIKRLDSL